MTFLNYLKGYRYSYSSQAQKDLKKLDASVVRKIDNKLKELVAGSQALDIKKWLVFRCHCIGCALVITA